MRGGAVFDEGGELMETVATGTLEVGTRVVTECEGHHCTNIGITTMRASVPGG